MDSSRKINAVAIGASAGGIEALRTLFAALPSTLRSPLLVVLHSHPDTYSILGLFREISSLPISEAKPGERVRDGYIYLAPPDYHLLVEPDGSLSLSVFDRINYARPAVDALFYSAADYYGPSLAGVILTGAQFDGSQGLRHIKERGGMAIVQDPATAEVPSMPEAARLATNPDHVVPVESIPSLLMHLCGA